MIFSILLLALITFLYRYSFISDKGRTVAEKIPQDFLKLLAPSTFTAIIANNLLSQQLSPQDFKLKCGVSLLSLFVAYFTKSIMATLAFGLILIYILQNY